MLVLVKELPCNVPGQLIGELRRGEEILKGPICIGEQLIVDIPDRPIQDKPFVNFMAYSCCGHIADRRSTLQKIRGSAFSQKGESNGGIFIDFGAHL